MSRHRLSHSSLSTEHCPNSHDDDHQPATPVQLYGSGAIHTMRNSLVMSHATVLSRNESDHVNQSRNPFALPPLDARLPDVSS